MRILTTLAIALVLGISTVDTPIYAAETGAAVSNKVISASEGKLRFSLRELWEARTISLRDYIVSSVNDPADGSEAKDALFKNASELGAAIRPYYGYLAGGILTGFLKKNVLLLEKVVKAAKGGSTKDLELAKKKWYANASSLAVFLAITRNQTVQELTALLHKHLDLIWGEIRAILDKDEGKDLDCYEKDRAHMRMFSDVLTDGIVRQLPKKFRD